MTLDLAAEIKHRVSVPEAWARLGLDNPPADAQHKEICRHVGGEINKRNHQTLLHHEKQHIKQTTKHNE